MSSVLSSMRYDSSYQSSRTKANPDRQARVPERLKPGGYDIWGSSHQIFHVLILMAIMSHLVGVLKAFHYHKSFVTCAIPSGKTTY